MIEVSTMWRVVGRFLATVVVAGALFAAPVFAQNRPPDGQEEPLERGPPVLQYTLAFLSIMLIMLILCMPSRKRVVQ